MSRIQKLTNMALVSSFLILVIGILTLELVSVLQRSRIKR